VKQFHHILADHSSHRSIYRNDLQQTLTRRLYPVQSQTIFFPGTFIPSLGLETRYERPWERGYIRVKSLTCICLALILHIRKSTDVQFVIRSVKLH